MLMTEQDIRKQTASILEAYVELTGFRPALSVSDFLKIRDAAVSEIKSGAHFTHQDRASQPAIQPHAVQKNAEQSVPSVTQERQQTFQTHQNAVIPEVGASPVNSTFAQNASKFQKPATKEKPVQKQNITNFNPNANTAEFDEYEILRRMKDPWN